MKKKFTLGSIIAFLILISSNSYSQLDSFKLEDYKLPLIRRHQLDFNLSSSGNSQKYNRKMLDDFFVNDNYKSLNGDFSTTYLFYLNSEHWQSSQNFEISSNDNYVNSKNYKAKNGIQSLNYSSNNRYYNKNNTFIEFDLEFSGSIENRNYKEYNIQYQKPQIEKILNANENKSSSNEVITSIPIYVGIGRIQPVEDARLAIYILKDLQKQKSLTRDPSNEEIIEFSELISKIKNERFFDSRLRKIHEIEAVDSFFTAKDLINLKDVKYFNSVNDNWDFASGPRRNTGHRFSLGFAPELDYKSDNYSYRLNSFDSTIYGYNIDQKEKNMDYGITARINYIYNHPINLYWQIDFNANLDFGKYWNTNRNKIDSLAENKNNADYNLVYFYNYFTVGYIPNSRTSIFGNLGYYVRRKFNQHSEYFNSSISNKFEEFSFNSFAGINANYYISPRFRLQFNYGISYNALLNNSSDIPILEDKYTFSNSFNLGIKYMIF